MPVCLPCGMVERGEPEGFPAQGSPCEAGRLKIREGHPFWEEGERCATSHDVLVVPSPCNQPILVARGGLFLEAGARHKRRSRKRRREKR